MNVFVCLRKTLILTPRVGLTEISGFISYRKVVHRGKGGKLHRFLNYETCGIENLEKNFRPGRFKSSMVRVLSSFHTSFTWNSVWKFVRIGKYILVQRILSNIFWQFFSKLSLGKFHLGEHFSRIYSSNWKEGPHTSPVSNSPRNTSKFSKTSDLLASPSFALYVQCLKFDSQFMLSLCQLSTAKQFLCIL